jgi:tyrosyl-tRNA synthetase
MQALDVLKERGFVAQMTHANEIESLLKKESVSFYIGFDPTADSLTAGHFLTVMAMAHMQRAGHRPIVLFGGATAMIGDPSGRSDMRKMLTKETIKNNIARFKEQMSRFIDFSNDKAIIVDNADWLGNKDYIHFIREVGPFFTVNRMLSAECYKSRMDSGLTFLEFNYMIMQSYDFLHLHDAHQCVLQLGGDDQWSNILGGVDLIRRMRGKEAYGLTFNLLTTKDGKKMGKTQQGAVWLDENKTSPYAFYQYWRNIEDESVEKCLALLTFLPMDEVGRLCQTEGENINRAKEVLAFELTKIVHGEEKAQSAQASAKALFQTGGSLEGMPEEKIDEATLGNEMDVITFLVSTKMAPSRSEARRLIEQGGIVISGAKVTATDYKIKKEDFVEGALMVQKGKKTFLKVTLGSL